jgi:hypothetical protein
MSYGADLSGSQRLTADGAVGVSGKPIRVFSATWLSGDPAGDLVLRNGTADSDSPYTTIAGAVDLTVTQNWEDGLLFPAGCFLDFDANLTSVVVQFRVEN